MASSDVSIRAATRADARELEAFWQQFIEAQAAFDERLAPADDAMERWRNDFPLWLDDATVRLWVACANATDEVVGFVRTHRTGPPPLYKDCSEIYIDELFVAPDQRRTGVATALVDRVARWGASVGADRLRLSSVATNEAARSFWDARGARPMATIWTEPIKADDADEDDTREGSAKIGFDWN